MDNLTTITVNIILISIIIKHNTVMNIANNRCQKINK